MQITTRRNLERNMKAVLQEVCETGEPIMVLSPRQEANTVILSKAKYDRLIKSKGY